MLTPQQNQDIHRFRQALYLYLSGEGGANLERMLGQPNPTGLMYRLGFWAEATSFSPEERTEGILRIRSGLVPLLERVESHDPEETRFFRQFTRIIVVDDLQNPTFVSARVGSFLRLDTEQNLDHWVVRSYVAF